MASEIFYQDFDIAIAMLEVMRRFSLVVIVILVISDFGEPEVFLCVVEIPSLAFHIAFFLTLTELNSDIDS